MVAEGVREVISGVMATAKRFLDSANMWAYGKPAEFVSR